MKCRVQLTIKDGEKPFIIENVNTDKSLLLGLVDVLDRSDGKVISSMAKEILALNSLSRTIRLDYTLGAVGNISIEQIMEQFPIEGGWPNMTGIKGIDITKNNILVKDGFNYYKEVENTHTGEKVIVVTPDRLGQLRNTLLSTKIIDAADEKSFSKELDIVCKHLQTAYPSFFSGKSKRDILKYYINNKEYEGYYEYVTVDGKSYYIASVIENEIRRLSKRLEFRIYLNEYCNALRSAFSRPPNSKVYYLKRVDFDRVFKNHPKFEEISKKFPTQFSRRVDAMIKELRLSEPEFDFIRTGIKGETAVISPAFSTLDERYPNFIEKGKDCYKLVEVLHGYNIYSFKETKDSEPKYLYTSGELTRHNQSKLYTSLASARGALINLIYLYLPLSSVNIHINTALESGLHYVRLNKRLQPGTIVRVLNVPVEETALSRFTPEEKNLVYHRESLDGENIDKTLKDFYAYLFGRVSDRTMIDYLNNTYVGKIPEIIDTPEKAVIFLYLRHNRNGNNYLDMTLSAVLPTILDTINGAKYKLYFIESVKSDSRANVNYSGRIVEHDITKPTFNTKFKTETPKIKLLLLLKEAIENKLKASNKGKDSLFKVKLLTTESILEDLQNQGYSKSAATRFASQKSFLLGNTIYINSSLASITDPIHEYGHIILGIVKALDYEFYLKILEAAKILNEKKFLYKKEDFRKSNLYEGLSDLDLDEEIFVELYANHIVSGRFDDFITDSTIDDQIEQIFKDTVMDLATLKDAFNFKKGVNIFLQFNAYARFKLNLLRDPKFTDTLQKMREYRLLTNKILEDIKNKVIQEGDCK